MTKVTKFKDGSMEFDFEASEENSKLIENEYFEPKLDVSENEESSEVKVGENFQFEFEEKNPNIKKLADIYEDVIKDINEGIYVDLEYISSINQLWPGEVNALYMALSQDVLDKNEQNKKAKQSNELDELITPGPHM